MIKFNLYDVFTPTKPAGLTFVERTAINEKLVDSLRTPGKQLVIFGHSGSGKTTLIINKLNQLYGNHIITRCMRGMMFDQMILDAFDQLQAFYLDEKLQIAKSSTSSILGAEYLGIKAEIKSESSKEKHLKKKRIIPPQLTPQRLAKFIGSSKSCWVIEDFHKISSKEEKEKLSQVMKIFMDMADEYKELKIITVGTMGSAREIIAYDKELRNRVAEIYVPLMNEKELKEIINYGAKRLSINFYATVKRDIIRYSSGLASVCHQLALNCCVDIGLMETVDSLITITENEFKHAIQKYVEDESDTTKAIFDKAMRQDRKQKYDNFKHILYAIAKDKSEDGILRASILSAIRSLEKDYPAGNLTRYLEQLQSEDRGEIIRFDDHSGKYSFSNPFHKVFALAYLSQKFKEKFELDTVIRDSFYISKSEIYDAITKIIKNAFNYKKIK